MDQPLVPGVFMIFTIWFKNYFPPNGVSYAGSDMTFTQLQMNIGHN